MFHFTKKRAVVMAVIGSLALGAGAYAYFTTTGSGTGTATSGEPTLFTISSDAPTGGLLTPGGPVDTVAYRVTNPSTGNQMLTKVAVSIAGSDGAVWKPAGGCTAADFSVGGADAGAAYDDLENAGNTPPSAIRNNTVTIQMVNAARDQNDCQGVTVPLYFSAT